MKRIAFLLAFLAPLAAQAQQPAPDPDAQAEWALGLLMQQIATMRQQINQKDGMLSQMRGSLAELTAKCGAPCKSPPQAKAGAK